jgi:hypothetical protein
MLDVGEKVPSAVVWTTPRESATIDELVDDRPILLVFYLFDWSAT